MKKAIIISALALCACNTAPTLTYQQQVSLACGAAQGEIAILQGDGVFTGGAEDTLTGVIQPKLTTVCTAAASATKPDLQDLVNVGLPALKGIVDGSSLSSDDKNAADAAIDSAVLAANMAISLAASIVVTAPVAASQ